MKDSDSVLNEVRNLVQKKGLKAYIPSDVIMQKSAALCAKYSQQPSHFLDNLEAFVLNANEQVLTLEMMGGFEQVLMNERKANNRKAGEAQKDFITPRKRDSHETMLGKRPSPNFQTPHQNILNEETSSVPVKTEVIPNSVSTLKSDKGVMPSVDGSISFNSADTYSNRTNRGQIVKNFNSKLGERGQFISAGDTDIALGARCQMVCNNEDHENVDQRFRFMFTTLDERARALDRHLLCLQQQMCALVSIDEADLQPVGVPSQDLVWVCGRIYCEAAEGRINKSSVILEGSRRDSSGRRVLLNLSELQSYSLFPGQIVLVRGINSSGRQMAVKQLVEGVALPRLTSSAEQLLKYHYGKEYQNGGPLHVVTAAGPFTTKDNLSYEPLLDLLRKILETKPDVVVLMGPFVDIKQELLASGEVQLLDEEEDDDANTNSKKKGAKHYASYEMVFVEKIVRDGLSQMFNSEEDFGTLPTKFVLIPSLRDAHHEFVFPQPPFGDRDRVETDYFEEPLGVLNIPFSQPHDKTRRVYLLSNPCMFRINEVLFAACSNDVLMSLSSDSTSQNLKESRLRRLSGHIIMQQSFSPQFPSSSTDPAQFDMRHSRHWEWKTQPDILLIPSVMQVISEEICGALVVNPGHLARGNSGGTFANLHIHPHNEAMLREKSIEARSQNQSDEIMHDIASRTSVSIERI